MDKRISNVNLSRETLKGTTAKFVIAAIGFAGTIIFGRLLGPTSFGAYYELLSLSQVGARPVAGWAGAAKKRFSEAGNRTQEIVGANYLGTILWVLGTLALVITLSPLLEEYAGVKSASLLIALMLAPLAVFESLNVLVTGTGRVGTTKWIDALRSLLTFGTQLVLVVLGFGVFGMTVGFGVATLVTVPILVWYLKIRPSVPSQKTVKSMWSYAKYSIPTGVVGMTYEQFDILLLGALFTSDVTGQYKAVAVLTLPAFFVSEVASDGLMSKVSHNHSRGEAISNDISNVLAFASIVSLPLLFGGAAVIEPLVTTVFGPNYADATKFFLPLAVARVISTQTFPLYQAIEGIDRPDISFRIGLISLTVNVVIGIILALEIGPVGVVYATLIAESFQYVLYHWTLSRNTTNIRFLTRPFAEQLVASVIMYLVVHGLRTEVAVTGWMSLVGVIVVGGMIYFAILAVVSRQLRETVRAAFDI